jgi:hypothetical protein
MRSKNKAANKKARAKKKTAELVSRDADAETKPRANPVEAAQVAIAALPDKGQLEVARSAIQKQGFEVISATEARVLEDLKSGKNARAVNAAGDIKIAFGNLKASEKVAFVSWAAEQIGARIDTSAITQADDLEDVLPSSMRRNKVA